MTHHLKFLSLVNLLRACLGLAFGLYLIWASNPTFLPAIRVARAREADFRAFLWIGGFAVLFAIMRGAHGAMTIRDVRRSRRGGERKQPLWRPGALGRRLGLGLAVFDLINLTLFPLSTACGLYGLLIYRHADTVDFYEGKFS